MRTTLSKSLRSIRSLLILLIPLIGYSYFFDESFALWKKHFRNFAIQQGIEAQVVDTALRGLELDYKVLRLAAHQPEYSRPIWEYLDHAVSAERVTVGRSMAQKHQALLQQINQTYSIESQYLLAIWGMESSFGYNAGHYSVVRSLASLAARGHSERRAFWLKQLIAALQIIQQGDMSLHDLRGSWGGAIGHTQFMPTTFLDYAVDFDGDGKRDIQNSLADALASSANYLTLTGWHAALPWGEEVRIPDKFRWDRANPNNWRSVRYWRDVQHIRPVQSEAFQVEAHTLASIYLPAGYRGPAFLVYRNFPVILRYNNATAYALAVGHLADRIAGAGALQALWPRHEPELSRVEKAELQERLSAIGYSTAGIDGQIGSNTRAALRRWQFDVGMPSDGYATFEQLRLLRQQSEITDSIHGDTGSPTPQTSKSR